MKRLTVREQQIARLVAQARMNKQIARDLGLSEQTVKNHLHNIFGKLGIADRVSLAMYAVRTGLVRVFEERAS